MKLSKVSTSSAEARSLLHPYARCYPIENGFLLLKGFEMKFHLTLEDRFWEKVDRKSSDECWNWLGGIHMNGYGGFNDGTKSMKAHRFSWILFYGEIPEGKLICHKCDNRKCVNPNHLFLGTQKDNIQDRIRKGRSKYAVGERHGNHKLTKETVLKIKQLLKQGRTQTEIAHIFNIDHRQIHCIEHKKTWGWLDETC